MGTNGKYFRAVAPPNKKKPKEEEVSIFNTGLEGMFLFEKSLIGVYCNRLYDLGHIFPKYSVRSPQCSARVA